MIKCYSICWILKLITENISRKYFQWLSNFPSEEVNCKKVLEHTCTQNNFSSRYRKASIWNKIEFDMKILTRTFLDQISFWRSLMVYNQISYNGKQYGIQFSTCMYLFLLFLIYKAQSLKCGFMKTTISLQIHHPYTYPSLSLARHQCSRESSKISYSSPCMINV